MAGFKDFTGLFPKLSREEAEDYAAIYNFLHQKREPFQKKNWGGGYLTAVMNAFVKAEDLSKHNTLELKHGFTDPVAKIEFLIQPPDWKEGAKTFFGLFIDTSGVHQFIDPGAPATHGPTTHRVQWNILMMATDEKQLGINSSIKDLYALLGDEKTWNVEKKFAVWDLLVDLNTDVISKAGGTFKIEPDIGNQPEVVMPLLKDKEIFKKKAFK